MASSLCGSVFPISLFKFNIDFWLKQAFEQRTGFLSRGAQASRCSGSACCGFGSCGTEASCPMARGNLPGTRIRTPCAPAGGWTFNH